MNRNLVRIVALILIIGFCVFLIVRPIQQAVQQQSLVSTNSEADQLLQEIAERVQGRKKPIVPAKVTMENLFELAEKGELWFYLQEVFEKNPFYSKNAKEEVDFLSHLPRGLQIVYFHTYVASDLQNGGIRQVFHNLSPWGIDQAINTFRRIGANETADDLERAIEVYEQHTDWMRGSIERFAGPSWQDEDYQNEPVLNAIDERSNQSAIERDWNLLIHYVHEHPEEFIHDRIAQ